MRATAAQVREKYDCKTWQDLEVAGSVVIQRVLDAIDAADFSVFDVTYPNENVLFEAGYAIARGKPIWLTLDSTISQAKQGWNELAILKPIGYEAYKNSADLAQKLRQRDPVHTVPPLYDSLIEPALPESATRTSLLYGQTFEPFEAANRLSTLVEARRRKGLQVVSADPTESSLNPITWYAPQLGAAAGVLINFAGTARNRANIHNARNSLVAGLAVGLEIPLLMLAEEDYARPFDYEDRLVVYNSAAACVSAARGWLDRLEVETVQVAVRRSAPGSRLAGLRAGEHVAENELADLSEYFVRTSAFYDVVGARDTLFVGHRGTGKTANAMQAFEELSSNKEILAVLIKPSSFEFPALLAAMERIPEHSHEYLFDTLWRFLVQTELAAAVLTTIDSRPTFVPAIEAEETFKSYAEGTPFDIRADMSVRLDQALLHLARLVEVEESVESGRSLVNEAFHTVALAELRHQLGPLLRTKKRVAVFIDNLDKGWKKSARLDLLAMLILGLLSARGRLVTDFAKQDWWRDEVKLTMAVFLRSDIFTYVKKAAREPDKLNISTITWTDPEILMQVLVERVQQSWAEGSAPPLYGGVFCQDVGGLPTEQYFARLVLPRPRDLVYLANAAISRAIDRRHDQVLEEDLLAATETYSQYAYEALLVENGITIPELEEVLFSFLGGPATLNRSQITARFVEARLPQAKYESVLTRLVEMSFLGVQTGPDEFQYPEVGSGFSRSVALARRHEPVADQQRFRIHQAFWAFLQVVSVNGELSVDS